MVPMSRKRSEEHTSELQSQFHLVCRLLLEKSKLCASRNALGAVSGDSADCRNSPFSTLFPYTTLFRSVSEVLPRATALALSVRENSHDALLGRALWAMTSAQWISQTAVANGTNEPQKIGRAHV